MTKVQIGIAAPQQAALLSWLQDEEVIHVAPLTGAGEVGDTDTGYLVARVQFALEFISRLRAETGATAKRSLKNMFAGKPIASLEELNATLAKLDLDTVVKDITTASDTLGSVVAEQQTIRQAIDELAPWTQLQITGAQLAGTDNSTLNLVAVTLTQEELWLKSLKNVPTATWQVVKRVVTKKTGTIYYEVVTSRDDQQAILKVIQDTNAVLVTLPVESGQTISERSQELIDQLTTLTKQYASTLKESAHFISIERDLKLAYDGLLHLIEREQTDAATASMPLSFVIGGWVPTKQLKSTEKKLAKVFPSAAMETTEPDKDEVPPVAFQNSALITPFEAVTDIFGKPKYDELDPTPALSLFFLVAFGLALSDAGYGLIMMAATFGAERFFNLKLGMRKMVRLLFYAGFSTVILGALTGGWFGLVLENLPANAVVNTLLKVKLIDPISSPITLLGVAFAIGIVQLLFAWGVNGYDLWRKGKKSSALLDAAAWITMVISILVWVAGGQGVVPAAVGTFALWFMAANAIVLIASQGREHKNPLLRLGSGVLSLYGLVSFLSDVLSYSRLLALGLATGIIGLVVNLIGGMVTEMIPVVGVFLAVIVLLGGHVFNLAINTLGAFIHAGRLQFVEFFPKFMEGGGTPFKPLGRVSKYVDNPRDFG